MSQVISECTNTYRLEIKKKPHLRYTPSIIISPVSRKYTPKSVAKSAAVSVDTGQVKNGWGERRDKDFGEIIHSMFMNAGLFLA